MLDNISHIVLALIDKHDYFGELARVYLFVESLAGLLQEWRRVEKFGRYMGQEWRLDFVWTI